MSLKGVRIGWAMAASHHNMDRVVGHMRRLVAEGAEVTPILSYSVQSVATQFGSPQDWLAKVEAAAGKRPLMSFPEVEPLGPKRLVDVVVICPCTGNALAKFANAVNDSPILFAAKAQLRNGGPVVLAISTNDALGMNAKNLGLLMNAKHVYFVPFGQDNPEKKPNSLDAYLDRIPETLEAALQGRQLQPVLIERWRYEELRHLERPA